MSEHGRCTVPWLEPLAGALALDGEAVLAVVASTQGSAPREAGATMVIAHDGVRGSIGGGHLEFEALRIARDALATPTTEGAWIVRFPLAARLGQCCGGVATLAFCKVDRRARTWVDGALACARTGAPFAIVTQIGCAAGDNGASAGHAGRHARLARQPHARLGGDRARTCAPRRRCARCCAGALRRR